MPSTVPSTTGLKSAASAAKADDLVGKVAYVPTDPGDAMVSFFAHRLVNDRDAFSLIGVLSLFVRAVVGGGRLSHRDHPTILCLCCRVTAPFGGLWFRKKKKETMGQSDFYRDQHKEREASEYER
nr:hypothetical protein [Pandoravirus massiliensis]